MKTAIVTCIDANYVEAAAVFFQSFSDNYHYREELDLVCVMPEEDAEAFDELVSMLHLDKRLKLHPKFVASGAYTWTEEAAVGDRWKHSKAAWYRLLLGSILDDYDKAIYFDPDVLIADNVQPIIDHPMYNKFMAVFDTVGVRYFYSKGRGDVAWLTSGMLIIDLDWWREAGIEELFKQDVKENGSDELIDEYLLNKFLKPYWHPLPVTFNFYAFKIDEYGIPDYDSSYLPVYHKHAIVYHFAGRVKPWTFQEIVHKDDPSRVCAEWFRYRDIVRNRLKSDDS
jgi:lipopolysaccharide biosynthesis glycosyltransferase